VDISGAGEYVIVGSAFNKENISIIASIDEYQFFYLVGRKDRGIKNVSDFKGKKIGVAQGTQAEFFLGRFLNLHGISLQDITRVDVQPSQFVDAIANGSVDAVIYIRQYNDAIKNRLGDNGVFWPAQSNQLLYSVMVSRNDWIASHPEAINRFLKSLDQSLILAMEDEARWMIKNNLTGEKKTPNLLDYIYFDGLNTIKPKSVNIIR
jgi:ABC-type nitrate/sulfonate/bicarbonate transport system substrate-binding protein